MHIYESQKIIPTVKQLTRKWTPRTHVINYEEGYALTEIEDIKQRWLEYSAKLSEAKDHQDAYKYGMVENKTPPQLWSEVEKALHQLNGGISPGTENVPTEL